MLLAGLAIVNVNDIQASPPPQGLDLEAVKNLARVEGLELISFSEKSRVISFRKSSSVDNVRINVYWTTGKVGTCLEHPRQGKTQLFRRNVDLSTLRGIFRNPRLHTDSGYHRRLDSSTVARADGKQSNRQSNYHARDNEEERETGRKRKGQAGARARRKRRA